MRSEMILSYIRKSEWRKLPYPLLLLATILFLLSRTAFISYIHTGKLQDDQVIYHTTARNTGFVSEKVDTLYYSGQDYWSRGTLTGHYYYALLNGMCQYFVINAKPGVPAEPVLHGHTVTGRISVFGSELGDLLRSLAEELSWNAKDLRGMTSFYYINETEYLRVREILLIAVLMVLLAVVLFLIGETCIYAFFPRLTPAYRRLRKYGSPEEILAEAEEELYNSVRKRTKNMVLTASYLIEFSADLSAIIPLADILWTYDHAAMHYTLKGRSMDYTIHVVTQYGDEYTLKQKTAEDVQVIYGELTARYPNYFYGYSKEHERMVRHIIREDKSAEE